MSPSFHQRLRPLLLYVLIAVGCVFLWRWSKQSEPATPAKRAPQTREARARPAPAPREDLGAAERNTIQIFNAVSPSVVSVANRGLVRDLFGFQVYEVPQGAGSGFIWDKEGHVISNYHVVHRASAVTVTLRDGTTYDAKLVGVDPDHDIAVLKIDAPPDTLVPVTSGSSRDLQVGQKVLAIGNPFGLDTSLSVGIVSALGRTIDSMSGRRIHDVIQTDAAINPGNSGGPLLDSAGRLIGINTAIISPSGAYAGIGFAVPVDTVRRIVPQLIESGEVRRAGLGVQIVPDHIARKSGVEGVPILLAIPGGAAAQAGLQGLRQTRSGQVQFGDILVAVDDTPVTCNDELLAILDRLNAGDRVSLTCVRDGKRRSVDIVLQELR